MTRKVVIANVSNHDEEVLVVAGATKGLRLRRGEVSKPLGVPLTIRLEAGETRKPGYLGELEVFCGPGVPDE